MTNVYIVAELGVNHNGSIDLAHKLIDHAYEAGANAVKFQAFIAGEVLSRHTEKAPYQQRLTPIGESQLEMVQKLELGKEQFGELIQHCRERGIAFLASPFDLYSLEMLVDFEVARLKIASGEITNAPLIVKAGQTGKEVILSTGMSTLGEVETALGILAFGFTGDSQKPSPEAFRHSFGSFEGQQYLREKVMLLHCTSEYPAPFHDVNLLAMDTLRQAFGLRVGYSDHTAGIVVPIAAAARGATLIEKHFTISRKLPGPDHMASLEPAEFKEMVASIRQVELALGSSLKFMAPSELENRPLVRKSLVAKKAICYGEMFTPDNLGIKRPGGGIEPLYYWDYLGHPASKDYYPDEVIK